MSETTAVTTAVQDVATAAGDTAAADVLVEDDLLVEEVSIDGMCGVY